MGTNLRQVTVVSGKGGTGKTTVVGALAVLAPRKAIADCDVDAANLYLLLHPQVRREEQFWGAKVAVRDEARCRQCGECERVCRFEAITPTEVTIPACEGCGACVLACPHGALRLEPIVNGEYYLSDTKYGPMAHAKLLPAAESSGRLVTRVRQVAEDMALERDLPLILIDGPPGLGCTAVAALADVDVALVVTEPTLSGIHDMERVVELAGHFRIPAAMIINKFDVNESNTRRIRAFCDRQSIPVLAELPYDETVTRAIAAGVPLPEYDGGAVTEGIRSAWAQLGRHLGVA
jgi:MinD superfamily P-loop ATPase